MSKIVCALAVVISVASAVPVWAAPQAPRVQPVTTSRGEAAGISLAAAASNIVYAPVRLAVTVVTGTLGGLTGWLTGGDFGAAQAIWNSTEGQAFLTPAIFEGREPLRFGR